MSDAKEKIWLAALRLFALDGYKAVSVRAIAGEIGLTKGALYKHYKNKRAIFDSIVSRMFQIDAEGAKKHELPEETFAQAPSAYRDISVAKIKSFTLERFHFWTEDEFARDFRKMLTLEQYRDAEMADLYQKCLGGGPVSYLEDIFREMTAQGLFRDCCPKRLALELYAPFYLLISVSDASPNKDEIINLLTAHIERFFKRYAAKRLSIEGQD
jgi:AcrR family transcriptional regulator